MEKRAKNFTQRTRRAQRALRRGDEELADSSGWCGVRRVAGGTLGDVTLAGLWLSEKRQQAATLQGNRIGARASEGVIEFACASARGENEWGVFCGEWSEESARRAGQWGSVGV